jgi:hypothetical protein
MAIGYPQRNGQAIKRGLNWLSKRSDDIAQKFLLMIMPAAMDYAREEHDHSHFGHRITRDSYGWAVVHNGQVVALRVNEGHHGEGEATAQLQEVAKQYPEGWVGLVLASMNAFRENGRPIIFEVDYELAMLYNTVDMIRDFFPSFIRRIQ